MAITVELTIPEMSMALNAAWLRIVASAQQRLNHKTTYDRPMSKRIQEEFVGACGEIAVGKAANKFFVPSVNTYHRVPDCLSDCEVRSTDREDGALIVRDNDSDERKFILAVAVGETVRLVGWLTGRDAKKQEWVKNPHGWRQSWFVPQSALRPIEEVIDESKTETESPV